MEQAKRSIVRALSPAYAGRDGELTAVLQYVYQAILLEGCGRAQESKEILKIAVEEMRHLEEIGALLVSMGVPPVFTACPPYPVGYYSAANVDYVKPLPQMLASDIRSERRAIAGYDRILAAVSDARVRETISRIRADEERHLATFCALADSLREAPPQDPPS